MSARCSAASRPSTRITKTISVTRRSGRRSYRPLAGRRSLRFGEGAAAAHTTALPAISVVAGADAAVGFFYHARGVLRRPGGRKKLLYNIMYGPPIFAPLLFGAAGMLGILPACCAGVGHSAVTNRRKRKTENDDKSPTKLPIPRCAAR